MKKWLFILCGLLISLTVFAQDTQPLPVDQAFKLSVQGVENNQLHLHWEIASGYHLYRDRFRFQVADPTQAEIGSVSLPPGIPKHDEILGDYQVYLNSVDILVPLIKVNDPQVNLIVQYQGCSESSFCYPPQTKKISVNVHDLSQLSIQDHEKVSQSSSIQEKITNLLKQRNYFLICLAFIGFGLLLAFTPCVLPMIPILSGIIVGQDRKALTTRRAFLLSLSYVLGMSFTYAIAGVLVALAGSHLAEAFQAPWVIIVFSILFVFLALSLFGFYELRLPHFLQHPIVNLSNQLRPGSFVGALLMGALSVLIVSPCVTAPLVGVLTFIAQTGDVVLGSTALFALGLGMGIPLLIIGTTEGKFLPKSGAWMQVIKSAFGVLLIAVAIYLLQRILPGFVSLMLWSALLIILAVYLGVGTHHRTVSSGWLKFGKGLGLFSFCYGVILLVGGALGNSDPLKPLQLSITSAPSAAAVNSLVFQQVKSFADVENAVTMARSQNKVVMLDFYADWCVACHEMDRNTFSDPKVIAALNNVILLRADVTANSNTDRALEDYYNVVAPPTILFFDRDGKELTQYRIVGGEPSQDFLLHLQQLRSQALKF